VAVADRWCFTRCVCVVLAVASTTHTLAAQGASAPGTFEATFARADVLAARERVVSRTPMMARDLVTLGAIESPSGKELQRAQAVARMMREIGLLDVQIDSMPNVTGRIKGRSGRAVVFVSTLDDLGSIPALQKAFGRPPRVAGDRVVGPGTNTSSTTVAMLAAAEALVQRGVVPEHDLVFGAVAQEETGLVGMKALHAQWKARADVFVDILGDGRSITYGALGIHWWRVVARGPAGHSLNGGLPNVNQAIARAVDRIFTIPQPPPTNNPRRTIVNVAVLRSGELFNHKPDSGWFSVDIRSLDADVIARNESAVRSIVEGVSAETGIAMEMQVVQRTPGGQIVGADTSRVVRASTAIAKTLGISPVLGNAGSANLNVPLGAGSRAIGIGGERGGRRGYIDEWADIPAMVRTAQHVLLLGVVIGGGQ
jgi:acetylornithine deacetylase/succinyl-diaminopimelate desuccinylase-like protein